MADIIEFKRPTKAPKVCAESKRRPPGGFRVVDAMPARGYSPAYMSRVSAMRRLHATIETIGIGIDMIAEAASSGMTVAEIERLDAALKFVVGGLNPIVSGITPLIPTDPQPPRSAA